MKQKPLSRIIIEVLLLAPVPLVADLLIPGDPGFLSVFGLPYLLAFPLVSAFYGFGWGLLSGVVSAGAGLALYPCLLGVCWSEQAAALVPGALPSAVLALIASVLIAFSRDRNARFRKNVLDRFRAAVHKEVAASKKNQVLEDVNRVLENRVSSQKDSITLLHNQVKKLASLDLNRAMSTILETVALFTEMSAGVIWTLDGERKSLVPAAVFGWDPEKTRETAIDPENSIEGYVLRNRKTFSARMVLDSPEFDRFDLSSNVIAMPLIIGNKAWGVLCVEELPFERYSQYSESVLAILLSLAEPYLLHILEYEALNAQRELDGDTGYPMFPMLYRILEKEVERLSYEQGFISLVVFEVLNFAELCEKWPRAKIKKILFKLKDEMDKVKRMKSKVFHFKEDSQLAMLLPDLDQNGTSYFCLDLLSLISGFSFSIDGEAIPVEILLGFSSSAVGNASADSMIATAEQLLSIQRL